MKGHLDKGLRFNKGDRVRLSPLAISNGVRHVIDPDRKLVGTVTTQSRLGTQTFEVAWPNRPTVDRLHGDYLEGVDGPPS